MVVKLLLLLAPPWTLAGKMRSAQLRPLGWAEGSSGKLSEILQKLT